MDYFDLFATGFAGLTFVALWGIATRVVGQVGAHLSAIPGI